MESIYFIIVAFLLLLAVFDLFVGVSNDAVNFLQSAIGAKVAKFRTVLIIASMGVLIGAVMSAGMMDVARHGIMHPANYSFAEVMTIFLAVMVTDVVILDIFNTLGMPTSTTVSLVFELLGATFILALFKMNADPSLGFTDLLNSSKALSVIIAIFVSVAIAFFFGTIVMWLSRLVFTFNYTKHLRYSIAIFGGIAFTALAYFIFIKGLGGSPFIGDNIKDFIKGNTPMLLLIVFVASTILNEILYLFHVNVFKIIVLLGTFALAMAFAGNDLVNFIGVPLAGLDSLQDYLANGNGNYNGYMMTSLMTSAKSPLIYLLIAGIIMIVAMATSKKAQNVVKTSVDLSRQDEGDEMFGSSKVARSIVRAVQDMGNGLAQIMPKSSSKWIDKRFNKEEAIIANGAAFDEVRAAVNLVLAAMLIIIGTNYKLPLSTTYVTFMVAMGSSLADKAWSRDSAVFRVTGVLSVIGGWFVTAGVAFAACALVCTMMHFGGFPIMIAFMLLDIYLLWRSGRAYKKKQANESKDDVFQLMMRTRDKDIVWDLLRKHVGRTQSFVTRFTIDEFNKIIDGLTGNNLKELRSVYREINNERDTLKKIRRQEFLAMRRIPQNIALERNTWFHVGANCNQQYMYCLRRMLDPIKEHVDNNFQPMPESYIKEFENVRRQMNELMSHTEQMISTNRYDLYRETLTISDECKDDLSALRLRHINRMQQDSNAAQNLKISILYLNILQESQELISIMRHQLRAARKFIDEDAEV
ncbi:MAG TPA: inorganic phosphate transporter [Prevotella sp.]|nr:inorganic phosphate transporter [Prevotella sp.]